MEARLDTEHHILEEVVLLLCSPHPLPFPNSSTAVSELTLALMGPVSELVQLASLV